MIERVEFFQGSEGTQFCRPDHSISAELIGASPIVEHGRELYHYLRYEPFRQLVIYIQTIESSLDTTSIYPLLTALRNPVDPLNFVVYLLDGQCWVGSGFCTNYTIDIAPDNSREISINMNLRELLIPEPCEQTSAILTQGTTTLEEEFFERFSPSS